MCFFCIDTLFDYPRLKSAQLFYARDTSALWQIPEIRHTSGQLTVGIEGYGYVVYASNRLISDKYLLLSDHLTGCISLILCLDHLQVTLE